MIYSSLYINLSIFRTIQKMYSFFSTSSSFGKFNHKPFSNKKAPTKNLLLYFDDFCSIYFFFVYTNISDETKERFYTFFNYLRKFFFFCWYNVLRGFFLNVYFKTTFLTKGHNNNNFYKSV